MSKPALAPQALALGIGAASGAAAWSVGLPLPWLLGAMVGTTAASLTRAPIRGPNKMRPFVIPVIGVMLGSAVTSSIIGQLISFWPALVLLPLFLAVSAACSFAVYRRIGKLDAVTAYFAAMPGGLNEMMLLGEAAGGIARRIALAHATRILVVICFVVLFYGLVLGLDSGGGRRTVVSLDALTLWDWIVLSACAVLGVQFGRRVGLPAPELFGSMIVSGAAHATGLVHTPPPTVLVVLAQIAMGTIIGCRFVGVSIMEVGRDVWLGVLSSLAMIAIALIMALALTMLAQDPLSLSFLVLSPGGLTEMSLLALAMGQDVVYVTTIHIVRISLVIALAGPLFRWFSRRAGRRGPPTG